MTEISTGTSNNNSSNTSITNNTTFTNFSSLPCFNLQWGDRRALKCVKPPTDDNNNDHHYTSDSDGSYRKRRNPSPFPDNNGISAVREKLMHEFNSEVTQFAASVFGKDQEPEKEKETEKEKDDPEPEVPAAVVPKEPEKEKDPPVEVRPWNLRTRRSACKEPNSKPTSAKNQTRDTVGSMSGEGKRMRLVVPLTKEEIEEDFIKMTGAPPVKKPKKRSRVAQKAVDAVSPAFRLCEVTASMYKVNHNVS